MSISLTTARSFLPTHQPISREKQTQIPNICQILSQIASPPPHFLLLANWTLFYLARHIFLDLPVHTHFAIISQEGSRLLIPFRNLLCSLSSNLLKHLIKIKYHSSLGPQLSPARCYKSSPVQTALQISQLSKLKSGDALIQSHFLNPRLF